LMIAPFREPSAGEIFDALVKTVSLLEKV